ncbi:cytochrome c peroxidase [Brasilonema sp. UFV-L1]|uniref:cytochrome-c peroxidase n=1 Tax=Brasilonema sp. UFV-L1 TaxID=2234130 RepID=UPI00145F879A|nr:cytochrome c peroxidase [Brasilonema sp. UFV-L1]NMG07920.1 cytochrome C peroxidase [Brasilonema sp. UFV-L1]
MSNARKSSHSELPELEETTQASRRRESSSASLFIHLLSRLSQRIQITAIWAAQMLSKFTHLASKWFRSMKRGAAIATLLTAAIIAGHSVSAQVSGLSGLSQVKVPQPDNVGDFIKDKVSAIALGKSLFWDMQLGSDGIQSCASCHFHAGADNRSKNQINPGRIDPDQIDTTFNTGGRPNYQLTATDYPFHKLADPNNRSSSVLSDSNDVTGSQGVFRSEFVDVNPGSDKDKVTPLKDDVFNVNGTNVRQVTPRHSPSVINAVFNFRNFWDGLAQNTFNGVNPLGLRDKNAFILKATSSRRLEDVRVSLNNSSLASQAVGPPLNALETAFENDTFAPLIAQESEANDTVSVTNTQGQRVDNNSDSQASQNSQSTTDTADSSRQQPSTSSPTPLRRIGRKLGKKLLALQPLAKQIVAYDDSVLGSLSRSSRNSPKLGLKKSYEALIRDAFKPEWWQSNIIIRVDPTTGDRTFLRKPKRSLSTIEYTQMEYNFSLFFGLAVQAYESTLVSDDTPFDKFLAGNTSALTSQQQQGWDIFQDRNKGGCIGCHAGSELTAASVSNVAQTGRISRAPAQAGGLAEDTGFFRIGVRPNNEDLGLGGLDRSDKDDSGNPLGNPLSEVRLAQQGKFKDLLGEDPPTLNPALTSSETVVADGAFKTPGLRNVELTAPYFHNGGQATLEQVVDFYSRGGDFGGLRVLNLSSEDKQALVAFLKALTDERVRYQKAPFDHPQLFVPNGHPGNQNSVTIDSNVKTNDGITQATDSLLEIPAVGQNGGNPLPNFLATS